MPGEAPTALPPLFSQGRATEERRASRGNRGFSPGLLSWPLARLHLAPLDCFICPTFGGSCWGLKPELLCVRLGLCEMHHLQHLLVVPPANQASSFWALDHLAFNTYLVAKLQLWCPARQLLGWLSSLEVTVSSSLVSSTLPWWATQPGRAAKHELLLSLLAGMSWSDSFLNCCSSTSTFLPVFMPSIILIFVLWQKQTT